MIFELLRNWTVVICTHLSDEWIRERKRSNGSSINSQGQPGDQVLAWEYFNLLIFEWENFQWYYAQKPRIGVWQGPYEITPVLPVTGLNCSLLHVCMNGLVLDASSFCWYLWPLCCDWCSISDEARNWYSVLGGMLLKSPASITRMWPHKHHLVMQWFASQDQSCQESQLSLHFHGSPRYCNASFQ